MSETDRSQATLARVQRAVDARWATVVVSPPPFEAILARAQGRPPTPPSGPPLPLPSGTLGPTATAGTAAPATAAPATAAPATAAPATGSVTPAGPATAGSATAGSPGPSVGSAAATVGRGVRRVVRRLAALAAAGAVIGVAALGVVILLSDEPCGPNSALAVESSGECLSLQDSAEALLASLRSADVSTSRQFVADDCWGRIPDGIRALADGADVSVTGASSARGVGVVFLDIGAVPVAPVPFTFADGRWRLKFCPALSLLGG